MKNISYRLWKHLNKKTYASQFICMLHEYLSKKFVNEGRIDSFYPLIVKKAYKIIPDSTLISYKKFFSLQLFENVLETLVVGSSHGFYGYRAEENRHEINACENSQDLYYSYELYKKYSDAPRLKNIILFYSVFSPGFILELSCFEYLYDSYNYFYGIPYRFIGNSERTYIKKAFSDFVTKIKNKPDFHYVGNLSDPCFFTTDAQKRAEEHLKCNKRDENQTAYVLKAAKLAKEKEHHLYVVIPPVRSDYISYLPPFEELFTELLELKNDVKILSFFKDDRFVDSDFGDTDHLNEQGAQKLTTFIRDMMK